MNAVQSAANVYAHALPHVAFFVGALAFTLLFVPLCRRVSSALGMVDLPGPRRINKTPIPRGGGVAIVLALWAASFAFKVFFGEFPFPETMSDHHFIRLMAFGSLLSAVGFADDKFSLSPRLKLAGQIVVAVCAFCFCGVGFHAVFPGVPLWLDLPITVFWIVGAVNAFNLIDGLDGLASGLALIAALGMAGTLYFSGHPDCAIFYVGFAGACLGFLRYNFNPASVFLGDSGSMFLGFVLATLPLATHTPRSLTVSLVVPLLTMGVPIFDTSLAILRRSVRAALKRREDDSAEEGETRVMHADVDHLHHRILRSVGGSQRKAAVVLYLGAAALAAVGVGSLLLKNRAAGLFIVAFCVGSVVVVKDMVRVELWDAGRLADAMAHSSAAPSRLHRRLAVAFYVVADVTLLAAWWLGTQFVVGVDVTADLCRRSLPLFVFIPFFSLIGARVYRIAWGRAQVADFAHMVLVVFAAVAAAAAFSIFCGFRFPRLASFCFIFAANASLSLAGVRLVRELVRDAFYAVDRVRMADSPDVERVLAYGAGIRYRAFRRELVRSSGHVRRLVVGVLDDDPLMKGQVVGRIAVLGSADDAADAIAKTRADSVVITCKLSPERLAEVARAFKSCGVKVSLWSCDETEL